VNLSFQKIKGGLFNFACRSGSLLAKFLLVIYISKLMSLEALGLYNIIAVTVAWSVYLLGFEFYSYSLRKIVGEDRDLISTFVFNQFLFHFVGFVMLVFLSPLLTSFGFIPKGLLFYFIGITLFDQLSQECYRILVAVERPQFANFLHFVKSGLWVYPLLILALVDKPISISMILTAWLVGAVLAFTLGIIKLLRIGIIQLKMSTPNVAWIRQGVVVSFPFLIISISQLTMDFSDRYLIDAFLGKSDVGVYSFYYGISSVPMTLISSVLTAAYFPKVINAFKFPQEASKRRSMIQSFLWQSLAMAVVVGIGVLILIHPLLSFIGKQELIEQIDVFYWMMAQVILFAVQVVVQTVLYARHADRFLLYSALAAAICNVGLNVVFIPRLGINGAVISTLISLGLMLGLRLASLNYYKKSNFDEGI
jgi:O-antigen/teichoic acid export membrane protein